ncbi:nucleoside hydrolase [bacterium]|nr:nucleoside hydrolase [bacterium]
MTRRITLGMIAAILFCNTNWLNAQSSKNQTPRPLIFDTDIGNDVDDVLALGMIHALQDRGECELLAVTITKDSPLAASFTDAVNTFYGRGKIPIGVCNSGITSEAGKFNTLAQQRDGGALRYEHDLLLGQKPPHAVTVLRSALAKAPDHSVAIAQVGFSTNLADLLASPPDTISPLSGKQLIEKKVSVLSIMAGAFKKIPDANGMLNDHHEYNVIKDIPSAQLLAETWPTKVIWSGFEIGIAIPFPHESIEQDFNYVDHHPLRDAYIAYSPPPHNRPTWDLTSVLYAVRPDRNYFDLSPIGAVEISNAGLTTFTESPEGNHQYLRVDQDQAIRVTSTLVSLSSQPPR